MAIKRYLADSDTTITNAYKANLTSTGVSGNMGLSDILEIFKIFGQASSGSSELSRILVKFPVDQIVSDRNANLIASSGSVEWYLKLYNARHSQTLPKDYTLTVSAVSRSWDEGYGLDMEEYSDIGYANWISAASSSNSGITNWTTSGGDYHTTPTSSQYFSNGTEDLIINVSNIVEQWINNTKQNYGFHEGQQINAPMWFL
jgi:hypothetical protein